MKNLVEVEYLDGRRSLIVVNNHILSILTAMHEPPYLFDELIGANRQDQLSMEEVLKEYPKVSISQD